MPYLVGSEGSEWGGDEWEQWGSRWSRRHGCPPRTRQRYSLLIPNRFCKPIFICAIAVSDFYSRFGHDLLVLDDNNTQQCPQKIKNYTRTVKGLICGDETFASGMFLRPMQNFWHIICLIILINSLVLYSTFMLDLMWKMLTWRRIFYQLNKEMTWFLFWGHFILNWNYVNDIMIFDFWSTEQRDYQYDCYEYILCSLS